MKRFENHPDELISASLSGDLTDVERRELDAHLATCQTCRETLEAFGQQRQLLAGMPVSPAPRDLGPRVRAGIDSGRFGAPWWRRPGGLLTGAATLATAAAAALVAAFFLTGGLKQPPVAASTAPSSSAVPSSSATPSSSPAATPEATPSQPALPLAMSRGDLIYPALRGSLQQPQFAVENNANGARVAANPPSGQLNAAALSPDGEWLAYIYLRGLSGANEVVAVHLSDGSIVDLGTTEGNWAFTIRLAWSPDGRYLAFTRIPFDMQKGQNSDPNGPGSTEVYLFDASNEAVTQLTSSGNAYAAGWSPVGDGQETLWVSYAGENPSSVAVRFPVSEPPAKIEAAKQAARADGVFLPAISPDGTSAIFWRGTMSHATGAAWSFLSSGMPYLTKSASGGIPSFNAGRPLFSDIAIASQSDSFATGEFGWSSDSTTLAFWDGTWTGNPQPTGYPDERVVYVGKASDSGLFTSKSGINLGLNQYEGIVAVALSPDGGQLAVTVRREIGGDLASPSASLITVDTATKTSQEVTASSSTPGWYGPGTYFSPTGAQ